MTGLVLFVLMLGLILLGMPIAVSIAFSSFVVMLANHMFTPVFQARSFITAINSYPLLAIPLFILAGELMLTGGLSRRLIAFCEAILGSVKASLAYASVIACTIFAAISGSSPATVAAIGGNMIPEMEKRGYPKEYATSINCASGILGVMIPPSIPMIVYGIAAEVSVGFLFIAGIGPGLLFAAFFCIVARVIYGVCKIQGKSAPFSVKRLLDTLKDAIWALLAPVIVLGGIYGGVFSPTEAAAVVSVYALIVGLFVYKELNFKNIIAAFDRAIATSTSIMTIVAVALVFGRILAIEKVPNLIVGLFSSMTSSPVVLLLVINVFLLIVGMFMDTTAAIIILTPIFVPLLRAYHIDPVHFGIILVVNLAIGFCTPPLGLNLFVASGLSKMTVEKVSKALLPYFVAMAVALLLITYVPAISLTIPALIFK